MTFLRCAEMSKRNIFLPMVCWIRYIVPIGTETGHGSRPMVLIFMNCELNQLAHVISILFDVGLFVVSDVGWLSVTTERIHLIESMSLRY